MASPIRVGLIGLSSSATTSWASAAHLPYLLSPRGRARYQIVALCNSTAAAAASAIAHYGLDAAAVRAYGDPAALAADPAVQLVVVVTRVDRHFGTALPAARAGKDLLVEWPVAENAGRARELARAVAEAGAKNGGRGPARTAVGSQGRLAPVVGKVREVLASGRIGKVLSVEVRAAGGTIDREVLPAGLKYFTQREVGGNIVTIGFAHLFDFVQSAVGEAQDIRARTQIQRPDVRVRDPSTGAIAETVRSDVPDLVVVTAALAPSATVAAGGATLLVRYRRGQPFKGEPALEWTVNGEKGELRLVAPAGVALNADAYGGGVAVEVHDFAADEVVPVEWEWPAWQEELPVRARNIAALYEAFADGEEDKYLTLEGAVRRHEQVDAILAGSPA